MIKEVSHDTDQEFNVDKSQAKHWLKMSMDV